MKEENFTELIRTIHSLKSMKIKDFDINSIIHSLLSNEDFTQEQRTMLTKEYIPKEHIHEFVNRFDDCF